MAKKNHIPQKLAVWIKARKRHRLSHAHIRMARELGMNPKKFGKIDNSDQEPWKVQLRHFIEHLYFKRFGLEAEEKAQAIQKMVKDRNKKKEIQKKRKEERRNQEAKQAEPGTEPLEDPF